MQETEWRNKRFLVRLWRRYVVDGESQLAGARMLQQHYLVLWSRHDCSVVRIGPAAFEADWFRAPDNRVVPIVFEFFGIVGEGGFELSLMALAEEDTPVLMSLDVTLTSSGRIILASNHRHQITEDDLDSIAAIRARLQHSIRVRIKQFS